MSAFNVLSESRAHASDDAAGDALQTELGDVDPIAFSPESLSSRAPTRQVWLQFVHPPLEHDYLRFRLRQSSKPVGLAIAVCAVVMVVRANAAWSEPGGLLLPILGSISVVLGILVAVIPAASHPRAVVALAVAGGTVTANVVTLSFSLFRPVCVRDRTVALRDVDEGHLDACVLVPNAGAILGQLLLSIFLRVPAKWVLVPILEVFVLTVVLTFVIHPAPSDASRSAAFLVVLCALIGTCCSVALAIVCDLMHRDELLKQRERTLAQRVVALHRVRMHRLACMVLPPQLSSLAPQTLHVDDVRDRAKMAADDVSVGVVRVANMAVWAAHMLQPRIVALLGGLVEVLDEGLVDVQRASIFGDVYAVEAGLTVHSETPGAAFAAVTGFLSFAARAGTEYAALAIEKRGSPSEKRMMIATGIGRGPAGAFIVGGTSMRYVLRGAAVDRALAQSEECVTTAAAEATQHRPVAPDAVGGFAAASYGHAPVAQPKALAAPIYEAEPMSVSEPPAARVAMPSLLLAVKQSATFGFQDRTRNALHGGMNPLMSLHQLDDPAGTRHALPASISLDLTTRVLEALTADSACTQPYSSPELTDAYEEYTQQEEVSLGGVTTASLAAYAAFGLVCLAVQRGTRDRGRRFAPVGDTIAVVVFAVALGLYCFRLVHLIARRRGLPKAADVVLCAVAGTLLLGGIAAGPQTVAGNDPIAPAAFLFMHAAVGLPRLLWWQSAAMGLYLPFIVNQPVTVLLLDAGTVAHVFRAIAGLGFFAALAATCHSRYLARRNRFALSVIAQHMRDVAERNITAQEELVASVVPAAVSKIALAQMEATVRTGTDHVGRVAFGSNTTAVAMFRFGVPPTRRGEQVAVFWHAFVALFDSGDATRSHPIQLISTLGDTALVAGPLQPTGVAGVESAAGHALQLFRSCALLCDGHGVQLQAAGDVDWGFGALAGLTNKVYALFGPAVSNATYILRALPTTGPRYMVYVAHQFAQTLGGDKSDFGPTVSWKLRNVGRLRVRAVLHLDEFGEQSFVAPPRAVDSCARATSSGTPHGETLTSGCPTSATQNSAS